MEQVNALSLVKRFDGSYFYIIELGRFNNVYKYMLANWNGQNVGEPMIIYSHTKRSSLNSLDKEFFDNNLLYSNRLNRYLSEDNLYIGGIDRINNQAVRKYVDGIKIFKNYKVFKRNNNYILVENVFNGDINAYNINEFVNNSIKMNFESSLIYTEKDLFNMTEETDYVINTLLKKERVFEKVSLSKGYVGTVEKVNGEYRKVFNEDYLLKLK